MMASSGLIRAGLAVLVVVLAGACAFGLWHVVVGGVVNGNGRAAEFGAALAAASGVALLMADRARRRAGRA